VFCYYVSVTPKILHTTFDVDGVQVRIDTIASHGMSGYGFRLGERSFTGGGYDNPGAAKRAGRAAVRRAIKAREKGREALERAMREMRTIGRGPA
jgi:hypothetical protein